MAWTVKQLNELNTERLITILVQGSNDMTAQEKEKEKRIFKILAERGVIDYDAMIAEYERAAIY